MENKKPYLFYYHEGVEAWIPAPQVVQDEMVDVESLNDGDKETIIVKRVDMTEEEFNNLPER